MTFLNAFEWLRLPLLLGAFAAGVVWSLTSFRSKKARTMTALLTLAAISISSVAWFSNTTRRQVEEMQAGICSDGMWTDHQATCFARSGDYIIENFAAFDPDVWHGWNEVQDADVVSATEVNVQAVALQGHPFSSVGEVLITQELGGSMRTIQIRMMDSEKAAMFSRSADAKALFGGDSEIETLIAGAGAPGESGQSLIYCNLPARPFFYPRPGDLIAFKGATIAFGTVPRQSGNGVAQASYVTCSAAEIVRLEE